MHLPLRTSTVQPQARRNGRRRRNNSQPTRHALQRFVAASLEILLNAIDANDAETGAHVRRVATYALILADAADLVEHEQRVIELVALFHDIGKIHGALFDIVHDDATLMPADRRAIATHPQRGATVLAPLRGSYPELPEGVLSHHERWDGGGYPRGLKGRRIPLAARLIAIADTFDAVTHRRSYRDGRSSEVARNVILEGRGTQFDPELVDLFTFPPVFARMVAIQRQAVRWKPTAYSRRIAQDKNELPDITFRWRMGRQAARGWRASASDRPHRRHR
jgi:HD-GYP domain-containing protein (c-di-GMP phosphodiesterase class II)